MANYTSYSKTKPATLATRPEKLNELFLLTAERTLPNSSDTPQCLAEFVESLPDYNLGSFKLRELSHGEVLGTLKTLRSDTSTGPDGIPVKFVNLWLSLLLVLSLSLSITVSELPISLNDDPKLDEHFRPISILPVSSKVLEKLVAAQMISFFELESVLGATISSFCEGHSTATVLMGVYATTC